MGPEAEDPTAVRTSTDWATPPRRRRRRRLREMGIAVGVAVQKRFRRRVIKSALRPALEEALAGIAEAFAEKIRRKNVAENSEPLPGPAPSHPVIQWAPAQDFLIWYPNDMTEWDRADLITLLRNLFCTATPTAIPISRIRRRRRRRGGVAQSVLVRTAVGSSASGPMST
eukprot:gene9747-biopygen1608